MSISIKVKLLSLIISTLVIATISILFAANSQLTGFIDENQEVLYGQRIDTILTLLKGYEHRLQMTGQVEAYTDSFKEAAIDTLKKTYYNQKNHRIFPFIINQDGEFVLEPEMYADALSLANSDINKASFSNAKLGNFEVDNRWYVYKSFTHWNWVVGYTVPLEVKYAKVYSLRQILLSIMITITTVSIIVMWLVIIRITKPIEILTQRTQAIAAGDYSTMIKVTGSDEVRQLADNFNQMADAIKQKIVDLNREISERLQAEKILQKNEERLSIALKASNSGIWDWDIKTGEAFFDENYYRISGYEPNAFPFHYEEWKKRVHPDDIEEVERKTQLYLSGKAKEYVSEFRFLTRKNDWMWILGQGKIFKYDDAGNPIRFTGTHFDITERKQAELALLDEKERLAVTLRSIGDGVITTDTVGTITMLNNVAETLTGWTSDEAIGRPLPEIFSIFNALSRKRCQNPVERVLAADMITELENHTVLVSKTGMEIIISHNSAPIHDNENQIVGVVLVFRDMTEKQKLDDVIQKSQKLESLGILAGGIAHDFNNLLGGIFGYIEMAIRKTNEEKVSTYLTKSIKNVDRARALTRQLLTFAKGGAPIKKIDSLFPFVEKTAQFALSGSSISSRFQIQKNLWPCDFDKNQIGQVIDNLVINAQQAMPDGGMIEVSARNIQLSGNNHISVGGGNYVKISIKDQGMGIPKELFSRIYDPYYTTKAKGQGLGLATSYSIVKRHGGCMDIESEPGKGTTFHVYLPASRKSVSPIPEAPSVKHSGSGTFLVMDDEEAIGEIFKESLESFGYTVMVKTNGQEALDFFEAEIQANRKIAGMIFDLTIPGGMGGKEAIGKIRKISSTIPVFVASGYSESPIMANPEKYGFTASIYKPFMANELSELLETHMKKSNKSSHRKIRFRPGCC